MSDCDYFVSFVRAADREGWVYIAWTPARRREEVEAERKAHYLIGEPIPQQRELIGAYDTAEQARQACDQHHQGEQHAAAANS